MTLENLLGIGRLHPHKATATEIRRLLASAESALVDARRSQNSAATRFDMETSGSDSIFWRCGIISAQCERSVTGDR